MLIKHFLNGNAEMKRLINICMVFILLVGSSSNLLAGALCPHKECWSFNREVTSFHNSTITSNSTGHSCSTSLSTSDESYNVTRSSEHETKAHHSSNASSSNKSSTCPHCIGSTTLPTAVINEQVLTITRHDTGIEVDYIINRITTSFLLHRPEIIPTQGSPPGSSRPRHLLINVFRI
jgi:hypothetical protein